ncbi:DUF3102 domain-containing protein [Desulfitobacterium chlororespirans]|uniref:Protein export cytoplasm protein SecA ATPase RNA helicase n=1 Tax=Desulfitobacterium chlororespirans DSM 11544 TaxID=1121395 RepID=A0A1M7UYV4_9FIRM|nr:DUF3102 domain-containing protein [Desulfitobacterium chlororespirans]SHN88134.1 Protein of unknown function [Desulfitobacterium chlororespirans DSM 11544]
MNASSTERTPFVIAAEINAINRESRKMFLKNAIEVGRRLKEAKELLNHGEWLKWLKESVNYSKSTAENLMNLYKEYGPKLLSLSDDDLNSQALGNLTYTQAVLLLGLPEEEREEFVAQNDLDSMTTRQLSQTVKEHRAPTPVKEQPQSQAELQSELQAESPVRPTPQNSGDIQIQYVTRTVKPRRESSTKHESAPAPATESSPVTNYEEKCTACCQTIADAFQELLNALMQLARLDPQTKEKCSQNAGQLASYMVERLKEWPPVVTTNMKGVRTHSTYE